MESKVIRVSGETYNRLQRLAAPFEDTPDLVITKLLDDKEGKQTIPTVTGIDCKPKRQHLARGLRTPEAKFRPYIVAALSSLGGMAQARQVLRKIKEMYGHKFNTYDNQKLASGVIRWEKTTHFEALNMVSDGWLKRGQRGIWVLAS